MTESRTEHRERWVIRVTGDVQGVFYRAHARDRASELGLAGSAVNEADGSVRLDVEGPVGALEAFRAWCEIGSPKSRVEAVAVATHPPTGQRGFRTG